MPITPEELQQFQEFAEQQLSKADSLSDLVVAWEKLRNHKASVDALRQSQIDDESGDLVEADKAFRGVRNRLGC